MYHILCAKKIHLSFCKFEEMFLYGIDDRKKEINAAKENS